MARRCPQCSTLGPPGECAACGWPLDDRREDATDAPAASDADPKEAQPHEPQRQSSPPRGVPWAPVLIVAGVLAACLVGGGVYWMATGTGARCSNDEDCRARSCILVAPGRGVCSEGCHDDSTCPDGMRCGTAVRGNTMSDLDPSRGPRRMCVPTGDLLVELLAE